MASALFTIENRGEVSYVVEKGGKFRVMAGLKGGNQFFHVITKPTLKGAIGFAKKAAA